jgi:hypothetical protein
MNSDCGGGKGEEELGSNEKIMSTGRFYRVRKERRRESIGAMKKTRKNYCTSELARPCLRCVKQKRVLRA